VPEPRPTHSGEESAHDILAAEAFAMPAPAPRPRPELALPGDPYGLPEPHDILAAEEFAMPAPEQGPWAETVRRATAPGGRRWAGLAGAAVLILWLRRRR
jgi:hypothetical protein